MKNVCYHPRSCTTCMHLGAACGKHIAGERGHERCKGQQRQLLRTTVLTGKQGPAFGDRASHTTVNVACEDGSVATAVVGNWPRAERADALRAATDHIAGVYAEELWNA